MKDMYKLVAIRKKNCNLIGSRQKLMSNYAWLLINTNYNANELEQIDIYRELANFGEQIGEEFASGNYCKSKIRHIETYHKKRKAISNEAMIKFLNIKNEELNVLSTIKVNRDKQRAQKKREKEEKKKKAKELNKKGYTRKEIAKELGVTQRTIYNWLGPTNKSSCTI